MSKLIPALAATLALSLAPMAASQAAIITYSLQNVSFADGATASGSFKFNTVNNDVFDYSITTATASLTGFTYTDATSNYLRFDSSEVLLYAGGGDQPIFRYIQFGIESGFGAVGTFSLLPARSWECMNCSSLRRISTGALIGTDGAVPEPGTLGLVLPALAAIGALARRRRQPRA